MRRNEHALSVARPLYQIGDLVCVISEVEGDTLTDVGYITGVEIDPPYAATGWWYAVCIVGREQARLTDWFPQDEIAGRVIRGGGNHGT